MLLVIKPGLRLGLLESSLVACSSLGDLALLDSHWQFWILTGNSGFSLAILDSRWQFWILAGNSGFSLAILDSIASAGGFLLYPNFAQKYAGVFAKVCKIAEFSSCCQSIKTRRKRI